MDAMPTTAPPVCRSASGKAAPEGGDEIAESGVGQGRKIRGHQFLHTWAEQVEVERALT